MTPVTQATKARSAMSNYLTLFGNIYYTQY